MAKAYGRRLLAASCFLIGGGTIILIPVLWPLGYLFWKNAKQKEQEAARRQEAMEVVIDGP